MSWAMLSGRVPGQVLAGPLRMVEIRSVLSCSALFGWALWLSFALGRGAWGGILYVLPLLRSYQWFRFEALLQMWASVIAASSA